MNSAFYTGRHGRRRRPDDAKFSIIARQTASVTAPIATISEEASPIHDRMRSGMADMT
jgi:hypothetical protein